MGGKRSTSWKKGQSGNPKGMKPLSPDEKELRRLGRLQLLLKLGQGIDVLHKYLKSKDGKLALKAVELQLKYSLPEKVEVSGPGEQPLMNKQPMKFPEVTPEQWMDLATKYQKTKS